MDNNSFMVIPLDGVVYAVLGDAETIIEKEQKFIKDKCYVRDGLVYIYGGKMKEDVLAPGYFYKNKEGKYHFVEPKDPDEHSATRIKDAMRAKEDLCDPGKFKEITEEMAGDTADLHVFAPPIKENDDPLKRTVKMVLLDLQVDLKSFRGEFNKEYDLTNLKASVTKEAPMTMKYFVRWLEVLGLTLDMTVTSNGNKKVKRLSKPISMVIE